MRVRRDSTRKAPEDGKGLTCVRTLKSTGVTRAQARRVAQDEAGDGDMQGLIDHRKMFRDSFDLSRKPFSSLKQENNLAPLCLKMLVMTAVMNGLARRMVAREKSLSREMNLEALAIIQSSDD